MTPLVIYHDHCTDGFGAAYAAWLTLGDAAEYLPMSYGQPLTRPVAGRDVYILDFSFPPEETRRIIREAAHTVWLDHHKSAFEAWCGEYKRGMRRVEDDRDQGYGDATYKIILDDNKSGARLAWGYFRSRTVPLKVRLIDDRDRWQFHYADSKAFHAGLQLRKPWTFDDWHNLNEDKVIEQGRTALAVYQQQIDDRVWVANRVTIVPGVIDSHLSYLPPWLWSLSNQCYVAGLAVNSPIHQSEIGHELATASGTFGLVWYYDAATGRANCSLRSNGDYDVSLIAKAFGGGGHQNAAGFNIDMPTLLRWLPGPQE